MFCKIKPVLRHLDEAAKQTVMFAAKELNRYLGMAEEAGDFPVVPVMGYNRKENGDSSLEQAEENTLFLMVGHEKLPAVEDVSLDDAIYIQTKGLSGVLAATNARALLIAAYRFLKENGFAFVKPGKYGDMIPERLEPKDLVIKEAASYRHRGICIEGNVHQEGMMELIDWLPKAGMNSYFLQFLEPAVFFRRYYQNGKGHPLTGEEIAAMADVAREEIYKRSLLYHAVGHGWTCAVLGIGSEVFHQIPEHISEEQQALVNGKRDFWQNPLNTNLCYSNAQVRDQLTDTILEYCKAHKKVDYLHFWIADGGNNNCECEECVKLRSSDHYVKMLNELDEKLTANGLDVKIVFLIYSGLVWAPVQERIVNKDRFIMMFAPFLRDYTKSMDTTYDTEVPPYDLNHQPDILTDIGEHLSYYKDWRKVFDGDSFDFDYHYCQEYLFDLSGYALAGVLHQDIVNLKDLGMNGLMSCQVQRVFLPTALGMNTMAETLWNRDVSLEAIVDKTLQAQFGCGYQAVREYLQKLAEYNCQSVMHGEGDIHSREIRERMENAIAVIQKFRSETERENTPVEEARAVRNEASRNHAAFRHNLEGLLFFGRLHEAMYRCYLAESKEERERLKEELWPLADSRMVQFKSEFDRQAFFLPEECYM